MTKKAKTEDTYSYKGWMMSDNILKRAFGVWGHYTLANLIIAAAIIGVSIILSILVMLIVFSFAGDASAFIG